MSFFKAVGKSFARGISRQVTRTQVAQAGNKAYKITGQQIQTARKNGTYINGSTAYQRNKQRIVSQAYRNGRDRESFINDL